jgi:hypothetical protein
VKVSSKEFKTKVIVTCHDSERVIAEDWLTNQGFSPIQELQYASNEFWIEAEKCVMFILSGQEIIASSELDAAREFIEQNSINMKILDDEYFAPSIEATEILEYPTCVKFQTNEIGAYVLVYTLKVKAGFKAVGWSKRYEKIPKR